MLVFTQNGIYCPRADVYIDPWKPVKRALITHAHADHSRWGNEHYLAHHHSVPIIKHRLSDDLNIEGIEYGELRKVNGVNFSFHPAGHIIGSAQIRVEYKGKVWVVSGDYKLEDDGFTIPFESVPCHTFITECTFGLPVFKWKDPKLVFEEINSWWRKNQAEGKASILTGYSLGKGQRLLQGVDHSIGKVYTHGAVENTNQVIRKMGVDLKASTYVDPDEKKKDYAGSLIIAPPSALGTSWQKKFRPFEVGIASGWMALRGPRRRRAVDRGFMLSDHADWDGLNTAIKTCGCERVITTHGYTSIFTQWLQEQGYDATIENTDFEGELGEVGEGSKQQEVES